MVTLRQTARTVDDPALGALLAVEAHALDPSPAGLRSIASALSRGTGWVGSHGHTLWHTVAVRDWVVEMSLDSGELTVRNGADLAVLRVIDPPGEGLPR